MINKINNMIDWNKETGTKNYCGYCTSTPTGSICDGSCFKKDDNKIDHCKTMLKKIPEEIKKLKASKEKYKKYLDSIKNKFDPFTATTYDVELSVSIAGFGETKTSLKVIVMSETEIAQEVEARTKLFFNNIDGYKITKVEKSIEQIKPMY